MWKDASRAEDAAEVMKLTPKDLLEQKVIEGIIAEPADHQEVLENIDQRLQKELSSLENMTDKDLLARRYQRFRKF